MWVRCSQHATGPGRISSDRLLEMCDISYSHGIQTERQSREACPASNFSLQVLLRGCHLQLLFSHLCRMHISLIEDRPTEISPAEISPAQVRANEGCFAQICLCQVGTLYICLGERCLREIRAAEIGPLQLR